ncbi:MAG TPA: PAS domain S-box protein [Candidatus Limnocylindrales bacterium]|nr:PAS domain S-box protein [Candidatus Limnocylindrales bacterium]
MITLTNTLQVEGNIMDYPKTVSDMLKLTHVPVVMIDQESIFTYVNGAFETEYGWTEEELLGKPVSEIMPVHMRSGHYVGFARFLTTESTNLLGKPLPLKVCYKDGREALSNHYILGEKTEGRWRFSAIIDYPDKR